MKLSLLVMTSGKQAGKILEIKLPQFLIGRDPQCQLRPASPLISKRHCALIQREGKVFIRDFDSTNGTIVNDEAIEGEVELHHDDQLKIGPIHFTVHLEADAAATPPHGTKSVTAATPVPPTKVMGARPASGKPETPLPATLVGTGDISTGQDDDIAAMLLELEDGERAAGIDSIPEGSTVFDLKVPQEVGEGGKPAGDKGKPTGGGAKGTTGDTRSAAARILEKMTKRPRN